MSSKLKFLIINPNPTNLESIFGKINLQQSKNGPFEAALLLGDTMNSSTELPQTKLTASTYFTKGRDELRISIPESGESNLVDVSQNLTYMKLPITFFKLSSGASIAFVSADVEKETEFELIKDSLNNLKLVDILVTYSWPYAIAREEKLSTVGNRFVDKIVTQVQPRYHFAVGNERGKYFEFNAFRWANTDRVTRFISLGQEGSGEKWFYAFGLDLTAANTGDIRTGENPFTKVIENRKRPLEEMSTNSTNGNQTEIQEIKKPKVVNPDQCFFCLSNSKVETHMIVSIGTHSYLTVAKGPLTRSSRELPFSGHAIIIPIEHIATIRKTTTDVIASPIYQEIEQYKKTLVKAFGEQTPQFKLVFFEINRENNVHQHVQVLPIPADYVDNQFDKALQEKLKVNNEEYNKNHELHFTKFTDSQDPEFIRIINNCDFMSFTIYENENKFIHYVAELNQTKPVDLQFPRRVLAYTLKCPKRTYWDKCQQPKFKEAKDCEEFKFFYKDYDFTMK